MTQNHKVCSSGCYHWCRYLTSVSSAVVVGAVLGSEAHLVDINNLLNCCEVSERNSNHHVALDAIGVIHSFVNRFCEFYSFGHSSVHFPVARNNIFSHCVKLLVIITY